MSSLRNSLHRRQHKERSQLSNRTRLGFLEKHKDYVLRARDYHSKQDRLQRLRQKAAERNKDEFYWGMIRGSTQGGVHVQDRGNASLPVDIVKVLKTQDENYIRTMRTAGLKKIDKLKSQLSVLADLVKPVLIGGEDEADDELDEDELNILVEAGVIDAKKKSVKRGKAKAKHVVFVENDDETQQYIRSKKTPPNEDDRNVTRRDATTEDLGWKDDAEGKKGKKRKSQTSTVDGDVVMQGRHEEIKQASADHRTKLLKELSARLSRDRMLRYAERELEMQKLLMGKGARRKLKGVEKVEDEKDDDDDEDEDVGKRGKGTVDEKAYKPRVYKWRLERKR